MLEETFDAVPLWIIFVFTLCFLLLATEIGFQLGKRIKKVLPDKSESGLGAMVAASLALLGFLLAFVTSIAIGIYDERRQLVIAEASAIGGSYDYSLVLEEEAREQARQLLREYVALRLNVSNTSEAASTIARSEQILDKLWDEAIAIAREKPTPIMAQYLAALGTMGDLHVARFSAEYTNRIPFSIILGLFAVAFLTMLLDGVYNSYGNRRNILGLMIVVLIISVVFIIIFDLDRTQEGLVTISQRTLLHLQQRLNAVP